MTSRRDFLKNAGVASLATAGVFTQMSCSSHKKTDDQNQVVKSATTQRLSIEKLKEWQDLKYGMFICFGMNTYLVNEFPFGQTPIEKYNPQKLDVDQWIRVAKEAGMKYAVLTAKQVDGLCLWPSKYSDYTVENSKIKTDVVKEFMVACTKYDIKPAIYYCSWDNHHTFGSNTPNTLMEKEWHQAHLTPTEKEPLDGAPFTTSLFQNFMTAQIDELMDNYGPIAELWIDIPSVLGTGYRTFLYNHVAEKHPDTVIVMNHGLKKSWDTFRFKTAKAWPTDIFTMEQYQPDSRYNPVWNIEGEDRYFPAEACMTIGRGWYWNETDKVKPMEELVEKFQLCMDNKINYLLSVPPNMDGIIPKKWIKPLMELKTKIKL